MPDIVFISKEGGKLEYEVLEYQFILHWKYIWGLPASTLLRISGHKNSHKQLLELNKFSTKKYSGCVLLVLCPEYLRSFTILCVCSIPLFLCDLLLMTNICELLPRISLGVLEQFPCTQKEQEVLGSLHHPGASHSP